MKKFLSILTFLIVANATFAAITFTPTAIDSGYCKQTYYCKITATGGTAPYAYTVTSGSLPSGLKLDKASGVLSGILNYTRDTSITFTVQAKDKKNVTGTKAYTMYITNQVVGWADIVGYWQNIPNTFPSYGQIYNTWRLNTESNFWELDGNNVATATNLGTTSNYSLPFITNDSVRMTLSNTGGLSLNSSGDEVSNTLLAVDCEYRPYSLKATNLSTGSTSYAGYFDASGAATTNYGIYTLARNGTTNYALQVGQGNVFGSNASTSWGIGITPETEKLFYTRSTSKDYSIYADNTKTGAGKTYGAYFANTATKAGDNTALYAEASNSSGSNLAFELGAGNVLFTNEATSFSLGYGVQSSRKLWAFTSTKEISIEGYCNTGGSASDMIGGYFRSDGSGGAGTHYGVYASATSNALNVAGYFLANSGTSNYAVKTSGKINVVSLPTDSTGLATGDIYISSGTLKVKY
jgi:hypothetical protein